MSTGNVTNFLLPDELPQIPEVELQDEIGRGGMGVVYRGVQGFLGREVAVKVLSETVCTPERAAQFSARFQREAKILAALTHPNIVSCYQAGTLPSAQCYLVMEFVDGPNLQQWIDKNGPMSTLSALRLCRDLAAALDCALQSKIIHRDVKPENVLLRPREEGEPGVGFPFEAKLADLGLARPVETSPGEAQITMQGQVFGTPVTMSPEQFDDPDHVDHRTDIYALGCVLYHALTGKLAFSGRTLREILTRKQAAKPPDPRQTRGEISVDVAALVQDMLAYRREDRPQTYAELTGRLDTLIQRYSGEEEGGTSSRRRGLVALTLLALIAVCAVAYVFVVWKTPPPLELRVTPSKPTEQQSVRLAVVGGDNLAPRHQVRWRQSSQGMEPTVPLTDPTAPVQHFTAPVARDDYELHFEASLLDRNGRLLRNETLTVPVSADDDPPTAMINGPSAVSEGEKVQLTAIANDMDTPPEELGYSWSQVAVDNTPKLDLGDAVATVLEFVAPEASEGYEIRLELAVKDGAAREPQKSTFTVSVTAANDPPELTLLGPRTVVAGEQVTLTAELTDPDQASDQLDLRWEPIGEAAVSVTLVDVAETRPASASRLVTRATTFSAPAVDVPTDFTCRATLADGATTVTDTMLITVLPEGNLQALAVTDRRALLPAVGRERQSGWGEVQGEDGLARHRDDGEPRLLLQDPRGRSSLPYYLPRQPWRLVGELGPWIAGLLSKRKSLDDDGAVVVRLESTVSRALALTLRPGEKGFLVAIETLRRAGPTEPWRMDERLHEWPTPDLGHDGHDEVADDSAQHVGFSLEWDGAVLRARCGLATEDEASWTETEHRPEAPPAIFVLEVARGNACFGGLSLSGLEPK